MEGEEEKNIVRKERLLESNELTLKSLEVKVGTGVGG